MNSFIEEIREAGEISANAIREYFAPLVWMASQIKKIFRRII